MKEELKNIIERACKKLYKEDIYLINNKVSERTIVFRFGIYLLRLMSRNQKLKSYTLDIEYNRNFSDPKRTINYKYGVCPDLIIHKRGSNDNNLLIMECKTYWNSDTTHDIDKINDFTNPYGEYRYKYGVSIIFKDSKIVYKIKEAGKDFEKNTIEIY